MLLTMIINKNQESCIIDPNRSFGQLLGISSKIFVFFETLSYIEECFNNSNSKPQETED